MNRAERRRRQKRAHGNAGGATGILQKALADYQAGKYAAATRKCATVLKAQPDQADANHLAAMCAFQQGDLETAERRLGKAILAAPQRPDYHNSLGHVLKGAGRREQALAAYEKAFACDPGKAETHCNLGDALLALGRPDDGAAYFESALALDPDHTAALTNYGNLLAGENKYDQAISLLRRAMVLNPGFAGGYVNLGNALKAQGELAAAIELYNLAIDLNPGFVEALSNLTLAQSGLGHLDEALASIVKTIEIAPDMEEPWLELGNNLTTGMFLDGDADIAGRMGALPGTVCGKPETAMKCALLELTLAAQNGSPAAQAAFDKAAAVLGSRQGAGAATQQPVALLHFGRSGTGLMHALIDGHPRISTVPSIYLKGYFEPGVWNDLSAEGIDRLPERFVELFKVLFDAADPSPVPGLTGEDTSFLGLKEGMTSVGENHDQVLVVDSDAFCAAAHRLMEQSGRVDAGGFLRIIFRAYDAALGNEKENPLLFYHIHNPGLYARVNFLRTFPGARLMMMVREPLQSCESWIREDFKALNYGAVANKIATMLYDIDRPEFSRLDNIGIRMEDLKTKPEETIGGLCRWLGIGETPSLYEMTAQGKMWWGDPTSADFDRRKPMPPFGKESIERPLGAIFSESDQLLLATLYYPFRLRFGYAPDDDAGFARNLRAIRPMLDDLLDFEKTMAQRAGQDAQSFKRRGDYLLLRARLTSRWKLLDGHGDYPGMLTPGRF